MTKTETIALQRDLHALGYYSGPIDGIYGPNTERAYRDYWASRPVEINVPVVTPESATPWWTSRGVWGSLISLVAVVAGIAGHGFDAQEAADAIMPLVELVPLVLGAIGGLLAWWGRTNAKAPIDPTLVARVGTRDIRLPGRVRRDPVQTRSDTEYRDPRGLFRE